MDEMLKDARFAHVARDPKFRRIPKAERKVKIDHRFKGMFKDEKFTVKYTIDKRGRPVNHTTTEDLRKYYDLSSSEDEDVPSTSKKDSKKKVKDIKEKRKDKKTAKEIESKINSVKDTFDKKNENEKSKDDCLLKKKDLSDNETKTKEECLDDDESDDESSDSEEESTQKEFSQTELDKNDRQLHKKRKDENGKLTNEIKEKLRDLTVNYARGEDILFSDSSSEEESSEASGKIFAISYIHFEYL